MNRETNGKLCAVIIMLVFCIAYATAVNVRNTISYKSHEWDWLLFRYTNSINYQTIGLKNYDDNSKMILISEPSESTSVEDIETVMSKYGRKGIDFIVDTFRCSMGYDGWLADAVICINYLSQEDAKSLCDDLHELIYGTDYKAAFINLDKDNLHTFFSPKNLNISVSAEEIKQWFIQGDVKFKEYEDSHAAPITDYFSVSYGTNKILFSEKNGFVVWLFDKSFLDSITFRRNARKFALDADLILGAIAKDNMVAIIGRERVAPIEILPPMRVETIMMLACTEKDELSQSYERNNVFAGKIGNKKDYAPILLSDELWHTEYGSLLNVTDQMLKSWSENGIVEYDNFRYRKPHDWAFSEGAVKDLKLTSLTYNWNTAGAGYIVESSNRCDYSIYAVNRTGSLPVSYIIESSDSVVETDSVYMAEELAYDFFSNLSSPELVKVVQYASLYQIFRNFGVKLTTESELTKENIITTAANEKQLSKILKSINSFKIDEVSDSEQDTVKTQYEKICEYYELYNKLALIFAESEQDSVVSELVVVLMKNNLLTKIDSLKDFIIEYKDDYVFAERVEGKLIEIDPLALLFKHIALSDKEFSKKIDEYKIPFYEAVAHFVINPRNVDWQYLLAKQDSLTNFLFSQVVAWQITKYKSEINDYSDILDLGSLEDFRDSLLYENKDKSSRWIKCPTIVQSIYGDGKQSTGGHNLDSKVTPVRVDETLKKGQYRVEKIDGKKCIFVSSSDVGIVTPDLLRKVERTNIEGIHETIPQAQTSRVLAEVPDLASDRTSRGFNEVDHIVSYDNTNDCLLLNGNKVSTEQLFDELQKPRADRNITTPKTMRFEYMSEDMVNAIIDGMQSYTIERGELFDIEMNTYNLAKIKVKTMKDGTTLVSVPFEGKAIKAKTCTHNFVVPKSKAQLFIQTLKEYLTNPRGKWNDFLMKRKMKKAGVSQDEIREFIEYNKIALLIDGEETLNEYVGLV